MAVIPDLACDPILAVHGLRKTYRSGNGVHDVTFEVGSGETVAMLGPNGAGKTTTVRCIVGLMRPDAGSVSVLGSPPGSLVARQGTALGRSGRVHITQDPDGTVWVGGGTVTCIRGEVDLAD